MFRTAIEAEILFAACVKHLRFLKRSSGKTPLKETSSGKKIEAESAVPILVHLYIVIMVHKYRQSAKRIRSNKNNPQGLRVHKHIFVGNSRLVTAMTHTDNNGDNAEQREKRYYYHSDHLGSAQFVTDWRGRQYEHIEYTPYGELWIEEVAAGLDKLPFRFTGKEMDEETGLYYYGARYLDPKYSRWLSGDPALGDYIPKAPIDDEAKKHNENLPGMGGVFNVVNLHLYHYAGNNPVKYVDPDGDEIELVSGAGLSFENYQGKKWDSSAIYAFQRTGFDQSFIGQVSNALGLYDNGYKLLGKVEYSHNHGGDLYQITDVETGKSIGDFYAVALKNKGDEDRWSVGRFFVSLGADVVTVGNALGKTAGKGVLSTAIQIATPGKQTLGVWGLTAKEQSSFGSGVLDFAKGLIPFKGTYDAARESIDLAGQIYNIKNAELLKEVK